MASLHVIKPWADRRSETARKQGGGRFGGRNSRGGRRRGGRGRYDDDDNSSMTLAEWEARNKGGSTGAMCLVQKSADLDDT